MICNWSLSANTWLVLRIVMAAMFIESGIDKLLHWDGYMAVVATKSIPFPAVGLAMAVAVELLGSVALITDRWLKPAALAMAAYVFALGFIYFNFWAMEGEAAVMARKEFLKGLSVVAGLLLMALTDTNALKRTS